MGVEVPEDPVHVDVADVLRRGGVTLAFQPIVDVQSRRVVAVEALARFESGAPAMEVFHAASEQGLAGELQAAVLRRAVTEAPRLRSGVRLTVNVTAALLVAGPLRDAVEQVEVDGLVFELEDAVDAVDSSAVLAAATALRARGALVALDDAGMGYRGIMRVGELRPDWVKIDRSLVTGVGRDEVRRASIEMFTRVANRVGALTVAEGVETEEDAQAVLALGIPLAQGYLFGAPTPTLSARVRTAL